MLFFSQFLSSKGFTIIQNTTWKQKPPNQTKRSLGGWKKKPTLSTPPRVFFRIHHPLASVFPFHFSPLTFCSPLQAPFQNGDKRRKKKEPKSSPTPPPAEQRRQTIHNPEKKRGVPPHRPIGTAPQRWCHPRKTPTLILPLAAAVRSRLPATVLRLRLRSGWDSESTRESRGTRTRPSRTSRRGLRRGAPRSQPSTPMDTRPPRCCVTS